MRAVDGHYVAHLFQRLKSVLHSEIRSLGHPRAALLGFAVAILAYNVLAVLKRSAEIAPAQTDEANTVAPDVSTYYLALHAWQASGTSVSGAAIFGSVRAIGLPLFRPHRARWAHARRLRARRSTPRRTDHRLAPMAVA